MLWLAFLSLSLAAPHPAPTASGHLVVPEPLRLEPPEPVVGQPVTVTFRLRNGSDQVVPLVQLVAAARGPGARRLQWDAPHADFPAVSFLILRPGAVYAYTQTRTFTLPSDYFVEPALLGIEGRWGGIRPFRVNYRPMCATHSRVMWATRVRVMWSKMIGPIVL